MSSLFLYPFCISRFKDLTSVHKVMSLSPIGDSDVFFLVPYWACLQQTEYSILFYQNSLIVKFFCGNLLFISKLGAMVVMLKSSTFNPKGSGQD